jgi:hypothetical protein
MLVFDVEKFVKDSFIRMINFYFEKINKIYNFYGNNYLFTFLLYILKSKSSQNTIFY